MKNQQIAVHGLGYVGLTCAVHFARAGRRVIGFDPDLAVVQALNDGHPKAGEFLGYLGGVGYEKANLRATNNFSDILDADVHIIAVPTERQGKPHDGTVLSVLHQLWNAAKTGALIIVESTLTPGTIDSFLADETPGRVVGRDLYLAVCPRRDWFADPGKNLETLPRVIGGVTPECTTRAAETLKAVSPTQFLTEYTTAEITKALENALLHVPVMMIHQLACALPDKNIAEAVKLATTHWRLTPLHLNFGTGGRCVPLGTQYLVKAAGNEFSIGIEAMEQERWIRAAIADVAMQWKRPPATAAVLGIAYRPEFKDMGLSPGLDVAKHLKQAGFDTWVSDPMWTVAELEDIVSEFGLKVPNCAAENPLQADVVLLATPHKAFQLVPPQWKWRKGQVVIDAQGAWENYRHYFNANGVTYVKVGAPGWTGPKELACGSSSPE